MSATTKKMKTTKATESKGTKAPKAPAITMTLKATSAKPKGEAKPKRISALAAAAQVLKAASKPMRAQELIAAMAEKGLWTSPNGKTPHATLYAAMLREINDKGSDARFAKADRGLFAFNREAK